MDSEAAMLEVVAMVVEGLEVEVEVAGAMVVGAEEEEPQVERLEEEEGSTEAS